jgi:hypothetical protein
LTRLCRRNGVDCGAGGIEVKYAIVVLVLIWLFCGLAGAWMLDDLDRDHWKTIARGPITLVRAINDNPASIPAAPE